MPAQKLIIDDATYFGLPHASNSGIKDAHKMFTASDTGDWVPTRAFEFGSALDALLTNPGLTDTSMLTEEERQKLGPMRRSLHANKLFDTFFSEQLAVKPEYQAVWLTDEFLFDLDGMPILIKSKCKYDFWQPKHHFGADLKTLDIKTQDEFESSFKFFKYPMQGSWYMDIPDPKPDRFLFFGVSKKNFKVFVKAMRRGDETYQEGKRLYTTYLKSWCKLNPGQWRAA